MKPNTLAFAFCAALIALGAAHSTESRYPVNHTETEWLRTLNGLSYVQQSIHQSTLPANEAFTCDSILQASIRDIDVQVYAAMKADSTNKHK